MPILKKRKIANKDFYVHVRHWKKSKLNLKQAEGSNKDKNIS